VRQLVERMAAIPNLHGPVRLEIQQDANLAANIDTDWQQTLRRELEKRRLNITEEAGAPLLRIGLAETPTQVVLAASIHVADRDEVRLVSVPRVTLRAADLPVVPMRIERQLVYESADRILDASSLSSAAGGEIALLAYRSGELIVLRLNTSGEVTHTFELPVESAHASRDPRGELNVQANEAEILLPGKSCKFTWAAASEAKCHSAKTVWRGAAILAPPCDAGEWKLLAEGGDWTTVDMLQIVPAGAARNGSAPLLSDFPGPILNINGQDSSSSALVVTRNVRTGNYEVYKIMLACGN